MDQIMHYLYCCKRTIRLVRPLRCPLPFQNGTQLSLPSDSDNILVCQVSYKINHANTLLQGRKDNHKKAYYLQEKERRTL